MQPRVTTLAVILYTVTSNIVFPALTASFPSPLPGMQAHESKCLSFWLSIITSMTQTVAGPEEALSNI